MQVLPKHLYNQKGLGNKKLPLLPNIHYQWCYKIRVLEPSAQALEEFDHYRPLEWYNLHSRTETVSPRFSITFPSKTHIFV